MNLMKNLLFIFLLLSAQTMAQSDANACKTHTNRINQKRPTAYVTFERLGEKESNGERHIILRLHNNTSENLFVRTQGDETGDDLKVSYEVRWIPGTEASHVSAKLPLGTTLLHKSTVQRIGCGESLMFSVPESHLLTDFAVFVFFSYEREFLGSIGGDFSIVHQAPFWSTWLPKELMIKP